MPSYFDGGRILVISGSHNLAGSPACLLLVGVEVIDHGVQSQRGAGQRVVDKHALAVMHPKTQNDFYGHYQPELLQTLLDKCLMKSM